MEKSIIATGKTLESAIDAALRQLGMDRDSVSVEIIRNAKSGFLGFGAVDAQVKVTYEAPDEEDAGPKPALSSASRTRPRHVTAPVTAPVPQAPAAPGSTEERIETFIKGLLEHMGSDAVPHAVKTGEDSYQVDLVGDNLGMLIGRRGDTLDAIQHLTNYAVNRDAGKRARISVDAEHYRQKREESLQRLAAKVAGKVVKYRRNITLEPMNAYERHVIHAALQDAPNVTTYSTGTEPNRRIVVAYSRDGAAFRDEDE